MTDAGRIGRVVIVGAGLAGGNAAVTLREEGFGGHVVLVGSEPGAPYGRPPLSKTYLRGEESLGDWYVRPAEWYDRNDVELRTGMTAVRVNTDAREVLLDDGGTVGYDRLALCTGGRPHKLRVPGMDLPGVHLLRTVADCDAIKRVARPGVRAVVVGMGFIGSEVAASLRQLGVAVTAIFGGGGPLETVLGEEVGAVMARMHSEHGVELVGNDRVVGFEGSDHVAGVVTASGRRFDCDAAVVGAGIEPAVGTVAATAIAVDNGILVDARCRTNVADVYAAGDLANHDHPLFGRVRVEHYNSAEKMGRAAALSILGNEEPFDYVHSFWSDQYEDKLEYVGHVTHWDELVVRGDMEARAFLGFYLVGGVLRAAVGLNRGGDPELDEDSELRACQELIGRGVAVSSDLLADERVDLPGLAAT